MTELKKQFQNYPSHIETDGGRMINTDAMGREITWEQND